MQEVKMYDGVSRSESEKFYKINQDYQEAYQKPRSNQNTKFSINSTGILNLPTELINLIAIELCMNSRNQAKASKTKLYQRRRNNLKPLEFHDLLNFSQTCKTLHFICQRIYQKQLIINLPITKQNLPRGYSISPRSFYSRNQSSRRDFPKKEEEENLMVETINQLDLVSNQWNGLQNVNWVYLTNQTYQRLNQSNHFSTLISSTTNLIKSFENLRYLCLDKMNDGLILNCLEEGIHENLESLSINLSQSDDTKNLSIKDFEKRIQKINRLGKLKALQINDIQPTWIGLINQTHQLQSLSLHISEFSSYIISELDMKSSLKSLEILGGLRSPESSKRLLIAVTEKFPKIEVFKFGMHLRDQYDESEKVLKVDSSDLISRLHELNQFIFNHADAPIPPNFSNSSNDETHGQEETTKDKIQLERFFEYSKPYFEKCGKLKELISFDFSDRSTDLGIMAKKIIQQQKSSSEVIKLHRLGSKGIQRNQQEDEGKKWNYVGYNDEDGSRCSIPISMYKIKNIKQSILLPFESKWTSLCD